MGKGKESDPTDMLADASVDSRRQSTVAQQSTESQPTVEQLSADVSALITS